MEPITSQPTNNFGFQGENKGEGYVHGKSVIIFCIVVFKVIHKININMKIFDIIQDHGYLFCFRSTNVIKRW